ncbi:MAG: hypothetical protein FWC87_16755, partial [Acidimicrobiaceae bacterium]|nr:hypothetical protein [Acidimicrobiaceae bacterium]
IPGMVPSSSSWPSGCRFHPRCAHASSVCTVDPPQLLSIGRNRLSRCIKSEMLDENVHLAPVEEAAR